MSVRVPVPKSRETMAEVGKYFQRMHGMSNVKKIMNGMDYIISDSIVFVSIGVLDPLVIPPATPKYRPRKNNLKKINPEHI